MIIKNYFHPEISKLHSPYESFLWLLSSNHKINLKAPFVSFRFFTSVFPEEGQSHLTSSWGFGRSQFHIFCAKVYLHFLYIMNKCKWNTSKILNIFRAFLSSNDFMKLLCLSHRECLYSKRVCKSDNLNYFVVLVWPFLKQKICKFLCSILLRSMYQHY